MPLSLCFLIFILYSVYCTLFFVPPSHPTFVDMYDIFICFYVKEAESNLNINYINIQA